MSFEVKRQDLFGRIGKLITKTGTIETPALLPVVNPRSLDVPPKDIFEEFKYRALITNAYLLKRYFEKDVLNLGVHRFLNYNGIIMTDSGAYQLLRYGKVQIEPREIIQFQMDIKTDIGVILDIPTGWEVSRKYAEWTVKETLERARQAINAIGDTDILWVGPVQGGTYLDLVRKSATEISKLPFHIYALGSPTKVMEQYLFDILVKMVMTAKLNLPIEKPLHLFGAGHPFMFPLAVALGCDLFDSASYALYAKDDRYITETGTERIENLKYFPCTCPVCRSLTPKDLNERNYD
ncbi:MAG: tRNA guanosine(15) transglycosylase TgtA, partial [Candidatus Bathyarchaeia archaeon]